MTDATRLLEIRRVHGELEVQTGLRIGASQETMEISGLDNPIIRNPANAEPFIPGSSLKGRMRSLAEWYFGELPTKGKVTEPDPQADTARVFGLPAKEDNQSGPTRLIVRDALLTEAGRDRFRSGEPITEIKSENSINRLTAEANPRPMERILPGIRFECEFVYRIFDVGDDGERDRKLFDRVLLTSFALLELDALGGSGTRGCGKVKLDLSWKGEALELPTLGAAT